MSRDDDARAAVTALGTTLSERLTALANELAAVNQNEYARMLRVLVDDAMALEHASMRLEGEFQYLPRKPR